MSVQRKKFLWQSTPPPLACPWNGALLLLGPEFLLHSLNCSFLLPSPGACSLALQDVSTQPILVLFLELTSRVWVSAPSPCVSVLVCGVSGSGTNCLCGSLSASSSSVQLLHFSLRFWVPLSQVSSPSVRWLPRVHVPLVFHSSLSGVLVQSRFLFSPFSLSLFFSLLFYPVMWRVSCPFWRFKVFCHHSVDVLCKSFYILMGFFCCCLWDKVSIRSYYSAILVPS